MTETKIQNPRVSVVMGVYNDADRVERAVRGVLAQTFRNLELVIIDDGSSDGTAAVLDRLSLEDSRLRVIHQQNTGLTRALIHGCAVARGEFIARQDSDDWSHPLRIAEQAEILDRDSRVGLVSCATEYVGPKGEYLTTVARSSDPEAATHGLLRKRQGPPAHGSVMFRRSLYEEVGGYRADFYYSQDSDLWLRMGECMWIGYVTAVRYRHSKEPGSISGNRRTQQTAFAVLAHACREARESGSADAGHIEAARALTERILVERDSTRPNPSRGSSDIAYLIGSQLVRNGDVRAREYLWKVVSVKPWHVRAWIRLLQTCLLHGE